MVLFTSLFTLGSYEQHQKLKENLLANFAIRLGICILFGVLLAGFLTLINLLVIRVAPKPVKQVHAWQVGLKSLLIYLSSAFVGVCVFFFH